jgi:hypothetical protein
VSRYKRYVNPLSNKAGIFRAYFFGSELIVVGDYKTYRTLMTDDRLRFTLRESRPRSRPSLSFLSSASKADQQWSISKRILSRTVLNYRRRRTSYPGMHPDLDPDLALSMSLSCS